MTAFPKRLKEIVKQSGLSQKEFASRLNLSQTSISKLCNGSTQPSKRVLSDICRVFCINETWLLTGNGEMHTCAYSENQIRQLVESSLLGSSNLKRSVIKFLMTASESEISTLESIIRKIANDL